MAVKHHHVSIPSITAQSINHFWYICIQSINQSMMALAATILSDREGNGNEENPRQQRKSKQTHLGPSWEARACAWVACFSSLSIFLVCKTR